MKPNLFIIPGFGESTNDAPYRYLKEKLRGDFHILTYTPKWQYSTANSWINDAKKMLSIIDTSNTIVISFSLGAYIALNTSSIYKFKKNILCSISPFFKEQIHYMPKDAKLFLGKKRMIDFENRTIPSSIKSPSVFLFGSNDWAVGINEAKKLAKKYRASFELIDDASHELTDAYLEKIIFYIKK